MSKNASVSVLIPTFNSEKTIERALRSVFAQSLRPLEVIVVDDGSADDTTSIVKALSAEQEPGFIKLIELKTNHGCYCARNAGWEAASGEFLAFLDSDDSWHPRKLEIQTEYMVRHPELTFTAHQCICLSREDSSPQPMIPQQWKVTPIAAWQLMVSYQFWTPSVMLRANIPHRFDSTKQYSGDRLLWIQLLLDGYKAARLELPIAYLYKAPYGEGGLSSHLWETEKSELEIFARLKRLGFLNRSQEVALQSWSFLKYMRRVVVCWKRRYVP